MSSTTTNIGLYKKNPSTDGNDTFDINTMLNDNWDRIDAQLGSQVGVSPPPTAVNLVNGMQVVNVPQSSPLNNLSIKGRTLVNLLGRDGNCEGASKFIASQVTIALDSSNKQYGNNAIKSTISATFVAGVAQTTTQITFQAGKYYIVLGEVKNGNATSTSIRLSDISVSGNSVTDTTKFNLSYFKTTKGSDTTLSIQHLVGGVAGQYAFVDGIRVYELSGLSEYNAIDSMTAAQIAAKYPYVDDVKHVNAPYVIKYGENLHPTSNEWTQNVTANGSWVINSPYITTLITLSGALASGEQMYLTVPVLPNQDYTFSATLSPGAGYAVIASSGTLLTWGSANRTFNSGNNTQISVYVGNLSAGAGTFTFTNPMLNLGTTAKPFKPRNDDMLAFPNVQLASSVDGTVYDTLFKRDGKYCVEKRFKDVLLDGSLPWIFSVEASGYKLVALAGLPLWSNNTSVTTKYDGKILRNLLGLNAAEQATNSADNYFYVSIADTDSGWGETYTPTAQEIQAYFYGWVMSDVTGALYTSGTKYWTEVWCGASGGNTTFPTGKKVAPTGPTTTLPTTSNRQGGWTPYKLTYQLATPVFEEIQVDAGMSLHEGLNQIEVGQGVVIREKANPAFNTPDSYYYVNDSALLVSGVLVTLFKNRADRILVIYKNGKLDNKWNIYTGSSNVYGKTKALIHSSNYDLTATYEVSYIALDQYLLSTPVQAVAGEVASNLKTVVDTLATNSADQDARISAAEILARQIYNVPQKTSAAMTLYVDGTNGSDNNDGSAGRPFKTIQRAIDSIPQIVNHLVTINVASATYAEDIRINGFSGKSTVNLYGDTVVSTNVTLSSILVSTNSANIVVRGFNLTITTNTAMNVFSSTRVVASYMNIVASATGYLGVVSETSNLYINSSVISNRAYSLLANNGRIMSESNSGTGNIFSTVAQNGGMISRYGTQPIGGTDVAQNGGINIPSGGVLNPWGDNTQASRSRIYYVPNATQNISAGTNTKVLFQSVSIDNLAEFSSSRFTAKNAGTYDIKGALAFSSGMSTSNTLSVIVYKNGSPSRFISINNGTSLAAPTIPFNATFDLLANDYLEIYIITSSTTVLTTAAYLDITRIA
ncbi:hypothetical protein [Paenibacillus qinlingensis]|uniref:hypothetical protein n=1 Tax=Paenibacillus qinlingensis TaxID=1837343 RepID=UPI001566EB79|nr:hypothetical protein [Paenibacillus qinlingensis]NQX60446.1 hypothetical protein [Paenibacillus qinlingensis]